MLRHARTPAGMTAALEHDARKHARGWASRFKVVSAERHRALGHAPDVFSRSQDDTTRGGSAGPVKPRIKRAVGS